MFEVAITHFLEQLLKLLAHSRENHEHWFDSKCCWSWHWETTNSISFNKLVLCYKQDFLQWSCVALLCCASQNRRGLEEKVESCTGQGEPVHSDQGQQWPGQKLETGPRSNQRMKSGQSWNQGCMRPGIAGAAAQCNVTGVEGSQKSLGLKQLWS